MKNHTRSSDTPSTTQLDFEAHHLDLDALSDEELEALLFDDEPEASSGFWNLPTMAGLTLVVVGVVYLLQQMGLFTSFELDEIMAMLPVFAGILIILLGFGVLSWRPKKDKKKKSLADLAADTAASAEEEPESKARHRLTRSKRYRKIFGVCGGIAERLDMDPTLVRIAFVIGTLFTGGPPFVVAYLALAYLMPEPDPGAAEERVTIVRDGG